MIRILVASLLAGVFMFLWGWFYWGTLVMSWGPWGELDAGAEAAFVEAARAALPASGIYVIPDPSATMEGPEGKDQWAAKHRDGPLLEIYYQSGGMDPMSVGTFLTGYLHMVFTALLLALAMWKGGGCMRRFGCRLGLAFFVAVVAATWVDGGQVIWFYHPPHWEGIQWLYHASGLLLGGIVVAAIVKPASLPNPGDPAPSI